MTLSRWDANRAKKKGQVTGTTRAASRTGFVSCALCGARSRQPLELRQHWLDRHLAAKHPQETLF